MLGSKKKKIPAIDSLIGNSMVITGDVEFSGGLRVDGEIHGKVSTPKNSESILIVSETGKINGEIDVCSVVVSGEVHGPLIANELLELHPSASVTGDVKYSSLQMHPGAVVHGQLTHSSDDDRETAEITSLNKGVVGE